MLLTNKQHVFNYCLLYYYSLTHNKDSLESDCDPNSFRLCTIYFIEMAERDRLALINILK